MEKKYADIINEGKKNGESIEVINTKLKEAGANFHLNPDGGTAGWTEAEMAEGFIPAEEEPKDAQRTVDMRRRPAGTGLPQHGKAVPGADQGQNRLHPHHQRLPVQRALRSGWLVRDRRQGHQPGQIPGLGRVYRLRRHAENADGPGRIFPLRRPSPEGGGQTTPGSHAGRGPVRCPDGGRLAGQR